MLKIHDFASKGNGDAQRDYDKDGTSSATSRHHKEQGQDRGVHHDMRMSLGSKMRSLSLAPGMVTEISMFATIISLTGVTTIMTKCIGWNKWVYQQGSVWI